MKIAVESYELYNSGILLCKWFDTEINSYDEIEEYVLEAHRKFNFQDEECEMFIADYEDDHGLFSGECLLEAFKVSELIEGLEDYELKKVKYMINECGYILEDAINSIDDCEIYENTTIVELAEDFVDDGLFGDIPESITNYIDYNAIARDLSYDYVEYDGDIYRVN